MKTCRTLPSLPMESLYYMQSLVSVCDTISPWLRSQMRIGMFHTPEVHGYGSTAHKYISLSRASLATDCIYVNTSVTAVDAMILHVEYFEMSDDPGGAAKAWAALGTALKLAQSVCCSLFNLRVSILICVAWFTVRYYSRGWGVLY